MPGLLTGMVWYRNAEDFTRMKAMSTDSDDLPDTFEEWLRSARKSFDQLADQGLVMVKAYIDPDTFAQWCITHGVKMNGNSRAAWAQEYTQALARSKTSQRRPHHPKPTTHHPQ